MYNAAEALRTIAILVSPFMPTSAEKMMEQIGVDTKIEDQGMASIQQWGGIQSGSVMKKGEQLFPRIEDKQAEKIISEIESGASADKPVEERPADAESATITFDDFMKMDLRTGKIIEAEKIKKSKKLLKLQVDIGSEVRQVVAGIAECHEPDDLIGQTIILVANLKPAKLMGIESQGMILAASSDGNIELAGFGKEPEKGTRVR
jgi:methionyl-tRNA synthetase